MRVAEEDVGYNVGRIAIDDLVEKIRGVGKWV
jgi:hypothetical protein